MIRYLGGILVMALLGVPLLRAPSGLVGAVGALAGLFCIGGVVMLSIPLLTFGASLALTEYTLALWLAGSPPDLLGAIGLGVTLWLLFEVTGFAQRIQGVAVAPGVLRRQARSWIGTGIALIVLGGMVAIATSAVRLRLPPSACPVVVALGAVSAFLGVARALLCGATRSAPVPFDEER